MVFHAYVTDVKDNGQARVGVQGAAENEYAKKGGERSKGCKGGEGGEGGEGCEGCKGGDGHKGELPAASISAMIPDFFPPVRAIRGCGTTQVEVVDFLGPSHCFERPSHIPMFFHTAPSQSHNHHMRVRGLHLHRTTRSGRTSRAPNSLTGAILPSASCRLLTLQGKHFSMSMEISRRPLRRVVWTPSRLLRATPGTTAAAALPNALSSSDLPQCIVHRQLTRPSPPSPPPSCLTPLHSFQLGSGKPRAVGLKRIASHLSGSVGSRAGKASRAEEREVPALSPVVPPDSRRGQTVSGAYG